MTKPKKLIKRNAAQIGKYLEFRDPVTQKGTAPSFLNLESDRKGESRVPMSDRGHKFWSDRDGTNQHFIKHVGPILCHISGKDVYKPALLLEHDPTALRHWRAGATENDKEWMKKFDKLCLFVAKLLEKRYPGLEVWINMNPEDEEFVGTPRQANDQKRTWDKFHSYRLIGAEIERVMIEEDCGIDAAKGLVSQRTNKKLGTPCSFSRTHQAWLFWQSEKKESA